MYNAWRKHGEPSIVLLAVCFDEPFAYLTEKALIEEFNSTDNKFGYNSTDGGDGSRLSKEAQARQSATLRRKYANGEISKVAASMSGSRAMKGLWQNKEFAEKKAKASSDRMKLLNSDPDFVSKCNELRASQEYKSAKSEICKKLNADPIHAIKVGNGKARQYAKLHGRPFTQIEFLKNGGIRVISPT